MPTPPNNSGLREKFEELAAPLRADHQKLSTLDSVRIIEGKA